MVKREVQELPHIEVCCWSTRKGGVSCGVVCGVLCCVVLCCAVSCLSCCCLYVVVCWIGIVVLLVVC